MTDVQSGQAPYDLCFLCEADDAVRADGEGCQPAMGEGLLASRGYRWVQVPSPRLADSSLWLDRGVLDPAGLACRALVIWGQSGLATPTLRRVAALARAGLRVFVVGDEQLVPPRELDEQSHEAWSEACQEMLLEEQVSVLDHERQLVAALRDDGLLPAGVIAAEDAS